jgi:hypothetical protein
LLSRCLTSLPLSFASCRSRKRGRIRQRNHRPWQSTFRCGRVVGSKRHLRALD